jgi:hypothetical protein
MPLGGAFRAVLTGIAFVLAGLGIVSGVLEVLAARLLGLALTPMVFASPRDHTTWRENACNLTAVGVPWIVADWLATRRQPTQNQQTAKLANSSLA